MPKAFGSTSGIVIRRTTCSAGFLTSCLERGGRIEIRPTGCAATSSCEARRVRQCPPQSLQVILARNFDGAQAGRVRAEQLNVKELKAALPQPFDDVRQSSL